MKTRISYGVCRITTLGCEMPCPLCGATVRDETHQCSKLEEPKPKSRHKTRHSDKVVKRRSD